MKIKIVNMAGDVVAEFESGDVVLAEGQLINDPKLPARERWMIQDVTWQLAEDRQSFIGAKVIVDNVNA